MKQKEGSGGYAMYSSVSDISSMVGLYHNLVCRNPSSDRMRMMLEGMIDYMGLRPRIIQIVRGLLTRDPRPSHQDQAAG